MQNSNNISLSLRQMSSPERSLMVTLAAQAMSSVGLSVSIIAWIWLAFVPAQPPEPILLEKKVKKARRRSAPATLQTRKRESLSPSLPPPDTPSSPPRARRVYFLDSPSSSRPTIERSHDSSSFLEKPLCSSPVGEVSPSSSSSTLVHTIPAIPPQLATWHESAIESDSSNNGSPRTSLSSPRPAFKERIRRFSGTDSVTDVAGADTKRRSSIGFTAPWRRASGSNKNPTPGPSTSPTSVPAPSYFSKKSARRVSTPVPRTQPYAYPYYAQPPIDDERYVAQLRGLPQPSIGGENAAAKPSSTTSDDSEDRDGDADSAAALLDRGRIRKANDDAQAALGHGRRPPILRHPQQRSASESWAAGKKPRL
ncbi:hypothetical protein FB45DRAFT_917811 [Roridomyces roridus]|uniref:Uncharacterized protein n=1 Tax=Roridomyces roridus TaxID=1738132 RepID=A0AAD7BV83_9AGAR|nr:hypothetical protein FB45DRAFT_917811 [Roridomyces roridus]